MGVGANSYGSAAQVAALTVIYTKAGVYDATTNPTLSSVESWVDSVSSYLNVALAGAGFVIPVAQADAKAACASIVVNAVVNLAKEANRAGKFATAKALEYGVDSMAAIRKEMKAWVDENSAGLIALGAARVSPDDQRYSSLTAGVISMDFAEHDDGTSSIVGY